MTFSPLISGTLPHNFAGGGYKRRDRRGQKVTRVIPHHWAGTSGGDIRLKNPNQQVSANYVIYSNGHIYGQVPEEYGAWTTGSAAADNPSITFEIQNSSGRAPGKGDMDPASWKITDAAWNAAIKLTADIAKRHGFANNFGGSNVRYHREFDATACPGGYIWSRRDKYIEDVKKALKGGGSPKPTTPTKPSTPSKKTVSELAREVIDGKWGNDPQRSAKLRKAGYNSVAVQKEVNRLLGISTSSPSKPAPSKSVTTLAKEVIDGKWGNDPQRSEKLRKAGHNPSAVQNEVNRLLGISKTTKPSKSLSDLAREVYRGDWGNDPQRSQKLRKAGYDPVAVQNEVNRLYYS